MSVFVTCRECNEPMIFSDKGIGRMKAEGETIEKLQTFICNDCIEIYEYIIEEKH